MSRNKPPIGDWKAPTKKRVWRVWRCDECGRLGWKQWTLLRQAEDRANMDFCGTCKHFRLMVLQSPQDVPVGKAVLGGARGRVAFDEVDRDFQEQQRRSG